MRFSDGLWLLRDGVKPAYALDVQDVKADEKAGTLNLAVASKLIRHRGDTLGGPLISIEFSSPSEGIIGVKTEHFASLPTETAENFELFPDDAPVPPKVAIQTSPETVTFTSGPLTARVNRTKGAYTLDFVPTKSPKKILTSAGFKSSAIIDIPHKWTLSSAANTSVMTTDRSSNPNPPPAPESVRYTLNELTLSAGELIYGLGEQFGPFVKNGQTVSIWNRDGGTSSEQAYKCVPFYLSNRGYGIFINHPGEVELEVGTEKASRVGISVAGESLQYYIIYGATPLEIIERYTRLTGRPALPPTWTFGLWLSTSFLTDYNSKTVSHFLEGMQTRKCDVRVFHFDCFWMKQYEWCSFTFDPDNFPDPAGYIKEIKSKFGVNVCLWINSYISQLSPIWAEGNKNGYFLKRTDGSTWSWDLWQPGLAIVDFTNPAATAWYLGKLEALLDIGVDAFKTDFGERIPHVGVKWHDGSDPYKMHNKYAEIYNRAVFELIQRKKGKGEAVLFARSATAGGQRFPVHWGGDCESTWEAMAETLRGGLSLTSSGFGFWSHDIGGFEGHPPASVYMRWLGFGLFSSHSRLHGSSSYRVPWNYGEEASVVLAGFVDAKHRLMPYLFDAAIDAHTKGAPVQRAMFFEFPEDKTTYHLDQQYMLGSSLLVAPVFAEDDEEVEWYLPAGTWTSFWDDNDVIQGPTWVKRAVPYTIIPAYVRQNSVLVLGKSGLRRPDYDYTSEPEIKVYGLAKEGDVTTVSVPSGKGTEVAAVVQARRAKDGGIEVEVVKGSLKGAWKASAIGAKAVSKVASAGAKTLKL